MSFTRGFRKMGGFPKDGEMVDNPGRFSREGWVHRADHDSVHIGGKQYRNMREWTRPCVVCGEAVTAYEKNGTVDASSRFGNRTCKNHRGLLPALERGFIVWNAELNGIVPGVSCASKDVPVVDNAELEALRMANSTMKQELEGLYATVRELNAKLAAYELGPAIEQIAAQPVKPAPVAIPRPKPQYGFGELGVVTDKSAATTERLLQEWLAKNNPQAKPEKMPWQS